MNPMTQTMTVKNKGHDGHILHYIAKLTNDPACAKCTKHAVPRMGYLITAHNEPMSILVLLHAT